MNIHHSTPTEMLCAICELPIMKHWFDAEETNGQSERFQDRSGQVVHYACIGGKSLEQINEERKHK